MNILVTGATGFVGTALVKRLIKEGHSVAALVKGANELEKSGRSKMKVYKADIADRASLERSFPPAGSTNVVFHLAACIDYRASKEKLFKVNAEGTLNLLDLSVKNRIGRFVFASSIEAMGPVKKEDAPATESDVCRPMNLYGESKLEAERHVIRFGKAGRIKSVIVRLGNVYGPESLSFIAPLANAIFHKDKRYLYTNRERYMWHPVYIDDAVEGLIKVAARDGTNDLYIIAGAEHVTVGYLSQLIAKELGVDMGSLELNIPERAYSKAKRLFSSFGSPASQKDERRHWKYSIEKAKKEFGYIPQTTLREGIAKTMRWAEEQGLLKA